MQLTLNHKQWETMRDHVESCNPLEGCGLLAGKDGLVKEVFMVRNQAGSAVRFRMEPIEQLHAFERMEATGLDLLGIFHSHPSGPESISATDITEAAYQVVQIIWSRSNPKSMKSDHQPASAWQARAFWIENGKPVEVTLQITDDE
jgi:proteasome lid subunit RPN8/RPN11